MYITNRVRLLFGAADTASWILLKLPDPSSATTKSTRILLPFPAADGGADCNSRLSFLFIQPGNPTRSNPFTSSKSSSLFDKLPWFLFLQWLVPLIFFKIANELLTWWEMWNNPFWINFLKVRLDPTANPSRQVYWTVRAALK